MNATTKSLLMLVAVRKGTRLLSTLSALVALVVALAAPAYAQSPAKAQPEPQAQPAVAKTPAAAPVAAATPSSATSAASSVAAHSAVAASGPASATGQESSTASGPADKGLNTGIKVHGHWVIDVKNPDGTLVTHREFENALANRGYVLALFLSRQSTIGIWSIRLYGHPTPSTDSLPCGGVDCTIEESLALTSEGLGGDLCNPSQQGCYATLQMSGPAQPPAQPTLVLSGTFTVPSTGGGPIDTVNTSLTACNEGQPSGDFTPAACTQAKAVPGTTFIEQFTGTSIAPIQVSAFQTVAVTVTITFSSGS